MKLRQGFRAWVVGISALGMGVSFAGDVCRGFQNSCGVCAIIPRRSSSATIAIMPTVSRLAWGMSFCPKVTGRAERAHTREHGRAAHGGNRGDAGHYGHGGE